MKVKRKLVPRGLEQRRSRTGITPRGGWTRTGNSPGEGCTGADSRASSRLTAGLPDRSKQSLGRTGRALVGVENGGWGPKPTGHSLIAAHTLTFIIYSFSSLNNLRHMSIPGVTDGKLWEARYHDLSEVTQLVSSQGWALNPGCQAPAVSPNCQRGRADAEKGLLLCGFGFLAWGFRLWVRKFQAPPSQPSGCTWETHRCTVLLLGSPQVSSRLFCSTETSLQPIPFIVPTHPSQARTADTSTFWKHGEASYPSLPKSFAGHFSHQPPSLLPLFLTPTPLAHPLQPLFWDVAAAGFTAQALSASRSTPSSGVLPAPPSLCSTDAAGTVLTRGGSEATSPAVPAPAGLAVLGR